MPLPRVTAALRREPLPVRLTLLLMLLTVLALAGCNTISGMGQDLSAAGRAIDQTAENAKN